MKPGRCGNDPRTKLTPGDQAAIAEFEAFLAERARVAAEFGVHPDQVTLRGCGHRCERCEQQPEDCACGEEP